MKDCAAERNKKKNAGA